MIILTCFREYLPKNNLFTMKIDPQSLRPEITCNNICFAAFTFTQDLQLGIVKTMMVQQMFLGGFSDFFFFFLVADTQLYERFCLSIRPLVSPSIVP